MKKRGATIKHQNATMPGLLALAVCPGYETRLRLAVNALSEGWMEEGQFNDLADTLDMLQIGMASYSQQKPDPSTAVAIDVCREAMMSVRSRYMRTGKFGATGEELKAVQLLADVSLDFWNRRSGALFAFTCQQLKELRLEQREQAKQSKEETEMNARDNTPTLPAIDGIINAAHKVLAGSKAPLCSEDVAKAINATKRATKLQIKEAEKQLKELFGLGILESNARAGGVSFYSLTVAPAPVQITAVEDDGCGACGDACASNAGLCRVKEESPPVCESVQAGGESQTGQSDDPVLHALGVMTRVASAARDLLHESEEFDFPDGLGRGAPQRLWDALGSEIEAAENDGAPIDDEMPPADPALLASANRMLSDRLEGVAHALRGCGLPALAEISGAEDLQMATAALSGAYQMAEAKIHDLETERTKSAYEFNDIGEVIAGYMPDPNGGSLIDGIRTMDMLIDAHRDCISAQEGRIVSLSAIANSADSRINSLVSDVTNARRALNDALNEADRMRTELAIERQTREALQEQLNAAPAQAPKGYVLKTSNQPMRGFRKQSWAQSAAMAAARTGLTGEVFALVPVGRAVRGAEWKAV